jgi:uncharacterized protein (DUF1919 family)
MVTNISTKINNRWALHTKQLRQYLIRHRWSGIKEHDFSLISSNCIGGRIYEELHIPYKTPTVGLFFFARDFTLFAANLHHYLEQTLTFTEISSHESANETRNERWYPVGVLDDIEVHFLHFSTNREATEKWERRKKRVNWNKIFFIFTDQGECTLEDLQNFDQIPHPNKISFVAGNYPDLKSCVTVPVFAGQREVGNLYTKYHLFLGVFDFTKWINKGVKVPYSASSMVERSNAAAAERF